MVLRLAFFCSVFLQPLCMLGNGRGKQITCASERGGKARGKGAGEDATFHVFSRSFLKVAVLGSHLAGVALLDVAPLFLQIITGLSK